MRANPDDDFKTCGASARDWASLMLTIFAVNVSWWLLYIPTIWQRGTRQYFNKVLWQCLRTNLPSVAAMVALKLGEDRTKWPSLYYYGPSDPDADPETGVKPIDRLRSFKVAFADTAVIVGTIMTIVQYCQMDEDSDVSGLNSSMFLFPSLPAALFGLLFVVGSRLSFRRRYIILLGVLVLGVVLAAFVLVMRFASARDDNLFYIAMFLYLYMTLPFCIFQYWLMDIFQTFFAVGARILGVVAGAMSEKAYFPYCELKNDVFGGIYLGVGLLGGFFALFAKYKWDPFPWKEPGVGRWMLKNPHRKNILRNLRVSTSP